MPGDCQKIQEGAKGPATGIRREDGEDEGDDGDPSEGDQSQEKGQEGKGVVGRVPIVPGVNFEFSQCFVNVSCKTSRFLWRLLLDLERQIRRLLLVVPLSRPRAPTLAPPS